jgi:hypothetical protein
MRRFSNLKILSVAFLTAFSLVVGTTGCGDADVQGGAGGAVPVLGAAAGGCAILAGSTITSTGTVGTVITGGDVCLSPGSSVTGFVGHAPTGPGIVTPPGAIRVPPDPIPAQAQLDWVTTNTDLAGRPGGLSLPGDLSGLTLTPGIYKNASSVGILSPAPGPLSVVTLDGLGNPAAVFVFQIGSTLTTNTGTQIKLTNGAQAKNVFWQVGSSATLGTGSTFNGNILALVSITLGTDATLNGRALAHTGAVTLDANPVTVP